MTHPSILDSADNFDSTGHPAADLDGGQHAADLDDGLLRSVRVWETDKNWAEVGDRA